jgi:hypothetical protein
MNLMGGRFSICRGEGKCIEEFAGENPWDEDHLKAIGWV